MRRREFIMLLVSSATAWPLAARAQQPGKIPKIGFFFPGTETVAPTRIRALAEGLQAVGYRAPDQVELITRVTGGDPSRVAPMAAELVERNGDVRVAASPAAVHALRSLTSTVPIVAYDLETDPIGSGMVRSLSRQLRAIEEVAGMMKLEVSIVEVRALVELDAAMAAVSRNSPD